jgi:hypothetical protein
MREFRAVAAEELPALLDRYVSAEPLHRKRTQAAVFPHGSDRLA